MRFLQRRYKPSKESIIDAMIAAEAMTGIENHKVMALPYDQLRAVLKKYNRLADQ